MGYTTNFNSNLNEVKADIVKSYNWESEFAKCEVLDSKGKWIKLRVTNKKTNESEIDLVVMLITKSKGAISYKTVSASQNAYYYNAPIKWINEFEPKGDSGKEWKVTALAIANKAKAVKHDIQYGKSYVLTTGQTVIVVQEYNRNKVYANWLGRIYTIKKDLINFEIESV